MKILLDLVFGGKLPFNRLWFRWVFEYALPIGLTGLIAVGYYTGSLESMTEELGEMSYNLLLLVLFIGPVAKILPDLGILRTLSTLRKEFGVGMFYLGLAHGASHLPTMLFYPLNALPNYVIYGGIALILTSLLYMTSNVRSMKLLKKNWKRLHRLIYLILILVLVHIYFLEPELEKIIEGVLVVGGLILVKVLVTRNITLKLPGKFMEKL